MKHKFIKIAVVLTIFSIGFSSCDVDPEFHSQVVPDTFYSNKTSVYQRFYRPFSYWGTFLANNSDWLLQELGTDEYIVPTRGSDGYNGGEYLRIFEHQYTDDMSFISSGWNDTQMGVALSWDAMEDLNNVDFEALGLEESDREKMLNQLRVLVAYFYMRGLDFFGGMPLYTTTQSEVKGRSTDVETFNFIDSLLNTSLPTLEKKEEAGATETGYIHQAAAAAIKAELYFNAKSYIGKEMWEECAQICQDIIDGKYGAYSLASDWTDIFGFNNETCPEIIWSAPSQNAKYEIDGGHWQFQQPYNLSSYLGGLESKEAYNGGGLTPSRDPEGNLYNYKLGGPYEKFNDQDIRKKLYTYYGNGEYSGMFIVGKLVNPLNSEWTCKGIREYSGEVITVVDQMAHFKRVKNPQYVNEDGSFMYNSVADLPSNLLTGEENSCVRVMKVSPMPTESDVKLMGNPDIPVIRLSEIYYMLAECKMRTGDKTKAAELINTVRKRYFVNGQDPNPVTAANLDKYRMLDEWLQEFLLEARRRTDLIRWDAYVTEDWWDHQATNNKDYNRFPLHYSVLNANGLLEQNPGY